LRSYFQAQNFELSEQWLEAYGAYHSVLRSTSELAPIKDSSDHLKIVSKKLSQSPRPLSSAAPPSSPAK
jgi:hypothetical protein